MVPDLACPVFGRTLKVTAEGPYPPFATFIQLDEKLGPSYKQPPVLNVRVAVPPAAGKLIGFALVMTIWHAEEFWSMVTLLAEKPFTKTVRCAVRKLPLLKTTLKVTVTEALWFTTGKFWDVVSHGESDTR
jgi:hypothetical protein